MTPYFDDGWASLYVGDALETLREMPDQSANMCVTSPPYWGLRDYGTASWEGGNAECSHIPDAATLERQNGRASTLVGSPDHQKAAAVARHACKCGARRIDRQLGLEPTPEEYVTRMVDVFREVRRVLRDDGTLWLNIGDSYAGSPVGTFNGGGFKDSSAQSGSRDLSGIANGSRLSKVVAGLKPKDLVGIPWMLAFALRADGWYLRSDIIWAKPNPMPESVTDRPTKAHEYLFLLSKRERYWYDADAIKESMAESSLERLAQPTFNKQQGGAKDYGPNSNRSARKALENIHDKQRGHSRRHAGFNDRWDGMTKEEQGAMGRNKRTVWTIATEPYPEAHFATFPTALVKPCVLAGCPEGGTVLEPFAGSGTTLQVAKELGRKSVGIELNEKYARLIVDRLSKIPQPFPFEVYQ